MDIEFKDVGFSISTFKILFYGPLIYYFNKKSAIFVFVLL